MREGIAVASEVSVAEDLRTPLVAVSVLLRTVADGTHCLPALLPWVGVISLFVAALALWRTDIRGPQPKLFLLSLPGDQDQWEVQASAQNPERTEAVPLQVDESRFKTYKENGRLLISAGSRTNGAGALVNDGPRSGAVWDMTSSSSIPQPWTVHLSFEPSPPLAVVGRGSVPLTIGLSLTAECRTFQQALQALAALPSCRVEVAFSAHRGPFSRVARRRATASLELVSLRKALEDYFRQNQEALSDPARP